MKRKPVPSEAVSETSFPDHTVIVPPNRLKHAINREGPSTAIATDALFRAEAALEDMKIEFAGWMNQECEVLESAREILKVKGPAPALMQKLFRAAMDVKGQAALFGYPLAAQIAGSLCLLISDAPNPLRIPTAIIDRHVDSIRAVVREGVRQYDDRTGNEIHLRLAEMVKEFLSGEIDSSAAEIAALIEVRAPKL